MFNYLTWKKVIIYYDKYNDQILILSLVFECESNPLGITASVEGVLIT